jgi:hypothetical protein
MLSTTDRKRAQHRGGSGSVHSASIRDPYYTYVGSKLGAYVNDATDQCTSPAGAETALQAIRAQLIDGPTVPTA